MYSQRPEIEKKITEFKKALEKQGIKTERIIMFGSQAKGTICFFILEGTVVLWL